MTIPALMEVSRRYAQVLRAAWARRHALDPVPRSADELAFLPAQLELVETPVSPLPRWSMRIIITLFALALGWAYFGQLDVVAVAPGQTTSLGRTKVIQPLEAAVVRRILVQDGQSVRRGQLLVELDALGVAPDSDQSAAALLEARLADLRSTALVHALDTGTPPALADDPEVPGPAIKAARALAASQFDAYLTKKHTLEAALTQKRAELHTTESAIEPLEQYAAVAASRIKDYEKLLDKHYVSRQDYLTRKQELINADRDVTVQKDRRVELSSAVATAQQQLAAHVADTRQQWLDEQRQARAQSVQYRAEVQRAGQRDELMALRAPVDGTVQELAIHTVGGVVTPAQPLLSVVPAHAVFEVQATVLDRDIGFVRPGQPVTVKLQSFPYTRYGYLTGTVESVSHDAVQDKALGLVFPARVKLDRDTLRIDGALVHITAGMGVSAEIKTGKRRVIDYLLSPLETHVDAAMRER